MTWLFDVNVLLAIADENHVFHTAIHHWLSTQKNKRWATCAITECGFIRVISQPAYRGERREAPAAIRFLRLMKAGADWTHDFWPDSVSITDAAVVNEARVAGPRQITDLYLAALAFSRQSRLVTFDTGIPWHIIPGAGSSLIEIPKDDKI